MSEDNVNREQPKKIVPMSVARTRAEVVVQNLSAAFIAEHGCKPSECVIEFGLLPNGKQTLRVRKLTPAEAEQARIQQVERDRKTLESLEEPVVYIPEKFSIWRRFFKPAVYLTARGAADVSTTGKARKVEVRA
jgi:hypothetical protein